MRSVLLRGYFGHGNWGDEILLRALITGLTNRGISASQLHYWRGRSQSFQPADIGYSAPRGASGLAAWVKAGAMILSGGIFYDHLPCFGSRRLRWLYNLVGITHSSGKKVVMFGVSIGPLTTPEGRRWTRKTLRLADGIWVRDRQSYLFCEKSGLSCQQIPDLSTALTSSISEIPAPGVQQELLFIPGQDGITCQAQINLLARFKPVAEKYDLTIRILPLHAEADTALARRLAKPQGGVLVSDAMADPMHLFSRIKAARLVVSVRLHGGWAAYLTGRPFIQINTHPKNRGFAETVHLPDECLVDPLARSVDLSRAADQWLTPRSGAGPTLVPPKVLEQKTITAFEDLVGMVNA